jgi:streptogramin lyase
MSEKTLLAKHRYGIAVAAGLLLVLPGCGLDGLPSVNETAGTSHAAAPVVRLTNLVETTGPAAGMQRVEVTVEVENRGVQPLPIQPDDFYLLSAEGDTFAQASPPSPPDSLTRPINAGASATGLLTFDVPVAALSRACLGYHPQDGSAVTCIRLDSATATGGTTAVSVTTMQEYALPGGVGNPWGIAADGTGNLWFAEPGCNFPFACPITTPAGQLGELAAGAHQVQFYPLPDIPGNQPLFVAVDGSGNIWFTTPNNSMIGEFDPKAQRFVGQWPVIPDSGPWDLTFNQGMLWYTEYFISGIGMFDPQTHTYRDFATPTPNSNPYGIVGNDPVNSNLVWFTENNSSVARIGVLDIANNDHIAEYPIRAQPSENLTPHLIALDGRGAPWWTEGNTRALGMLDPTTATPGRCAGAAQTCAGISEIYLPPAPHACPHSHLSGIAIDRDDHIWIDDSLSAQVGNYSRATHQFTLYNLGKCEVHPHDGLALDPAFHLWWTEEFGNALGELSQQ